MEYWSRIVISDDCLIGVFCPDQSHVDSHLGVSLRKFVPLVVGQIVVNSRWL